MNCKSIYFMAALGLVMSACSDSDNESGNDIPPAGALPSAEFTLNNLPDEPYVDDAVRIETNDDYNAPFSSLELLPDGTYLMLYNWGYYYSAENTPVQVAATADGKFSVRKKSKAAIRLKREMTDDNGTSYFGDGECGRFEKVDDRKYRLSNGAEFDFSGLASGIVTYTIDGLTSSVSVTEADIIVNSPTRSLCRTWNTNSNESWAYWNGHYVAHGKQTLINGKFHTEISSVSGFEVDNGFIDDDDPPAYKVVFSSRGTYICYYLDGEVEVSHWRWIDSDNGTLYWFDYDDGYSHYDDGIVTIRFAGSQMRVYLDYSEKDEGIVSRTVQVVTLTAASR